MVLGPYDLPEGVLTLHTPHAADGSAWSKARLANRSWLERAFPAWGEDWEADQSPIVWVERARLLRRARSQGVAPFVIRLDGVIIGEIGIDAIDAETLTGEGSSWAVRDHGAHAMNVASLMVLLHAFTREQPLARILGPASVAAREGRQRNLTALGFTLGPAVPRRVGDQVIDHDLWVLENTEDTRARLRSALSATPAATSHTIADRASAGAVMRWKARAAVRRARARQRLLRLSKSSVPSPVVLAGADTTSELAVTPVARGTRGRLLGLFAADRPAAPGLTVTITRGQTLVATAALRYDAGTGALRTSVLGTVDGADVPTFLDAVEAAAVAWWPESVALEWKHPATHEPFVEMVRSRGYVAALDEGVTTLWVRSRSEPT